MTEQGVRTGGRERRERHPLLHLFPLTVLALATFLVVFAMMMASLRAAPAPRGTSARVAVVNGKRLVVRTTSSGHVVAASTATGGSAAAGATPAIVTSSSGAGAHDD